ncbi:MAG: PEGA domain-containing protein [Candidatus Aminicenantes bacterium]|nr:PEGA domain-containing protein [Candidatus Aminicenantes bacterium]
MKAKFVALVVLAAFGTSCATVFKGNHSRVGFTSDPRGAKVYVNGEYMGDTPIRLKLESRHDYTVEFVKDGFKTKAFRLTNHIGPGWVVLDVILGLVPVLVDALTGSWYDLDQKHLNAVLERQQEVAASR